MDSLIRFKGYTFEHNPETLKITSEKILSRQSVLGGKSVTRELGDNTRVVTGEGKISGKDCIYKFMKLFKVKELSGSGILSLPNVKPFYAFFSRLEFSADPTPELISYIFEFKEDVSQRNSAEIAERYYTAQSSEDLWDISHKFGVPIDTLVQLNPQIKRTDEIEQGSKVRIW